MKITMKKPPLRGYVIGDKVVLQVSDSSQLCNCDSIEFHAKALMRIACVVNGVSVLEDYFDYRQITCGDALHIKEGSTDEEIRVCILGILRKYWKLLLDSKMLPPNECAFPSNVECSLGMANISEQKQ